MIDYLEEVLEQTEEEDPSTPLHLEALRVRRGTASQRTSEKNQEEREAQEERKEQEEREDQKRREDQKEQEEDVREENSNPDQRRPLRPQNSQQAALSLEYAASAPDRAHLVRRSETGSAGDALRSQETQPSGGALYFPASADGNALPAAAAARISSLIADRAVRWSEIDETDAVPIRTALSGSGSDTTRSSAHADEILGGLPNRQTKTAADLMPAAEGQGAADLYASLAKTKAAAGSVRRETISVTVPAAESPPAARETTSIREMDLRFQRDARRYNGGFTLF